jgi:hypothetical protein
VIFSVFSPSPEAIRHHLCTIPSPSSWMVIPGGVAAQRARS